MQETWELSTLPKTWIFDLDGTLVKHNGYKLDGEDTLLPGVADYLRSLPAQDRVLILTAREACYEEMATPVGVSSNQESLDQLKAIENMYLMKGSNQ